MLLYYREGTAVAPLSLTDLCFVVACNDDEVIERNLLSSEIFRNKVSIHVERGAPSAAIAYNRGLDATTEPIVVFVHQDVWLPTGWDLRLFDALDSINDDWALVAPFGMSRDGRHVGDVWSTSVGRRVGSPVNHFEPVVSVDELLFVLRRSSGVRFDESLPNWHFYGTEIVQSVLKRGRGAYVANLPVVHNDRFKGKLGNGFNDGYHFIRRKWKGSLPIRTSILWVTESGLSLWFYRFKSWFRLEARRAIAGDDSVMPQVYARQCDLISLRGDE